MRNRTSADGADAGTDLTEPEASELDDEDEPDAPAREEPTAPETTEVSAVPDLKRTGAA